MQDYGHSDISALVLFLGEYVPLTVVCHDIPSNKEQKTKSVVLVYTQTLRQTS